MKRFALVFFLLLVAFSLASQAGDKKVVYRKFTQYDFNGQTVQGKVRAPEVFYIFQRRRSEGLNVVNPPESFNHHRSETTRSLLQALPK